IVGVNTLTGSVTGELEILRVSHEVEREQNRVLAQRRAQRDQTAVDRALAAMVAATGGAGNLIEPMLDAARADATLGEICGALKAQWGEYREPARF
ncbi:MAG TPA: methylmalonyl-CoA mutase family protein, partial [Pseudonocardiaceae bacterium]|nr:methylmalonyl-CoA mutase family protein [Pseudonocardiaceae bacterium]